MRTRSSLKNLQNFIVEFESFRTKMIVTKFFRKWNFEIPIENV